MALNPTVLLSTNERIQLRAVPPTEADTCPPKGFPETETNWLDYECRARNNAVALINESLRGGNTVCLDDLEELVAESAFAALWHRYPLEDYADGGEVWNMWRGFITWDRADLETQASEDFVMRLACEGWLEIDARGGPWVRLTNSEPITHTEHVRAGSAKSTHEV